MSVRLVEDRIVVEGAADVADAEPILSALLERPGRSVDLRDAAGLHSATVQLLIALRPPIVGAAADPFFADWILPLIDTDEGQE